MKSILFTLIAACSGLNAQKIKKVFDEAEKQTGFMLQEIEKAKEVQAKKNPEMHFPVSLTPAGDLRLIRRSDWRSGFFPGVLWYLYEYSDDAGWKEKAAGLTSCFCTAQATNLQTAKWMRQLIMRIIIILRRY